MSLNKSILTIFLFVLDSSRTHTCTTGLTGKLLSKELFPRQEAKLWDPIETHAQVHRAPDHSPRDCSTAAPLVSLAPEGKPPSFTEEKPPTVTPPNSSCYSRSHSINPQLTELQRPPPQHQAAAKVRLQGSPEKQESGGNASVPVEAAGRGGQSKGFRWGYAMQRKAFPHDETPRSGVPSSAAT